MEQSQGISIKGLLGGLRRRILMILSIFVIGSVAAAGTAYFLPPVYESTARIQVLSQQIPGELARSTVTASAAERLQQIEQLLLTRENVLDVIDTLSLFQDQPDLSPSEQVDIVRVNTRIIAEAFEGGRRRGPVMLSAFTIAYKANNARTASRVANEFVTRMLEQNLRARTELATETREFFRKEVDRLADELLKLESEIASYKNQNEQALPDNLEFRLRELSTLEERLFGLEQRRIELAEQRQALQDAIELGQSGGPIPIERMTPQQRELDELNRLLVQKLSLFAETHPEIRSLKARIAAIEDSISLTSSNTSESEANAEAERVNVETTEVRRLSRQVELVDNQLALIVEQRKLLEDRREELSLSIAATPGVEMALSALERRYSDLSAQYEVAVVKEAEAATGERLEINQQAERFEVIEQAQAPENPIAPDRKMIAAGGAVGSLGVGIALALLLELSSSVIRTSGDLERRLQIRPIVTLPYIQTQSETRRKRLGLALKLLAIGGIVGGGLYAVDQYVMPLQVLWNRIVERAGIEQIIGKVMGLLG